jgi:membrane protein required for colicin V production
MNWLDLAVTGIVVLSAVFAFARGFVREALSIVAWVGAAAVTVYGFNWAYEQVDPHVHNPLLSQVIAGFGLFVGSLLVLTMVTGIFARMVHATGLSPIDRTLGFVFGLARGTFLVCLAYLLVTMTVPQSDWPPWLREAKSAPYLNEGADLLKGFIPEQLKIKSAEFSDGLVGAKAATEPKTPTGPTPAADPKAAADPTVSPLDPKTADKASAAEQAKKAAGALSNPSPPPAQPGQAPTYRPGSQRELDRLIGTQR